MDVSRHTPAKMLSLYGPYCLSGTPVSGNMLFSVILPLIEKVVLLMLMLVPAIRACEKPGFVNLMIGSAHAHALNQIKMGEMAP